MKTVMLECEPSTSEDVVSYKLEWYDEGGTVPLGTNVYPVADIPLADSGKLQFKLNDIVPPLDGVYDFMLSAIDEEDNESEPSSILGVKADFLAPAAPGPLSVAVY